MNNATNQPDERLKTVLATFEEALEVPLVPGELDAWCESAHVAFGEFVPVIRQHVGCVHPKLYNAIEEEDLSLAARVSQLQLVDSKNIEQIDRVAELLQRVADAAEVIDADESRVHEHHEEAVEQGLQLIIAIRRQEAEIETWIFESHDRDRGVAD